MIGRGFYAILDLDSLAGREPTRVAVELLDGGCVALQLRAKDPTVPLGRLLPLAKRLCSLAHRYRVPFVVNDHVPLAGLAGADAVHLGREDMEPTEARKRLDPRQRIGLSTHTLDQAIEAAALAEARPDLRIGYLGFGPVKPTSTKSTSNLAQGMSELARVCAAVSQPVVAIGGLGTADAAPVAQTGATAVAAISAVLARRDVQRAAGELHRAFREALDRVSGPDRTLAKNSVSS